MPWYEELARTPFFVWDPRTKVAGEHRSTLVQPAIDLAPTLLEYFGVSATPDMLGKSLAPAIANDTPVRTAGMFGLFGAQVNVTDGRYVYMRAPVDGNLPLSEYILMATCHAGMFQLGPLASAEIGEPFSFMKGCRPLRLPVSSTAPWIRRLPDGGKSETGHTRLYDLATDPHQKSPITDPAIEQRMTGLLVELMRECDAPIEQYRRLGLG